MSTAVVFGLVLMGTVVYCQLEDWNIDTSFYFTMITLMTVGYGDVDINNEITR